MKDYFTYNVGSNLPIDAFRISPSQLSKFFDKTSEWYNEHLLGASSFLGNTSTELGHCVHAAAAMFHDSGTYDPAAINTYLSTINNPDVDIAHIKAQYPIMADTLLATLRNEPKVSHSEHFVSYQVSDNVYLAGTVDSYDAKRYRLRDYKTIGSLDKSRIPSSFPRAYYFQQLSYAKALIESGNRVDFMELVYISQNNTGRTNDKGKPLTDYPSTVHTLTMPVLQADLDLITGVHKLVADSVTLWHSNPELQYILMQDYRLKPKPSPKLFKD